jgi:sec-independent protein translocase protein TatB
MSGIELLVVLAVAVIFVGPEHLPEMFRSAGKLMREVRRMTGDIGQVTREIRSSVNIDDIRNQLKAEMAAERERFRLLSQELEIDALKARKSTTTQSSARAPALMTGAAVASDATATAAAAADSGAPVAADMPSADVASSAGIMDADPGDAPLPPLPTIRPARHAVEAAAATAAPPTPAAPAAASDNDSTGDPA